MTTQESRFTGLVESRFPGLIEKIRQFIQASETRYEDASASGASFLWEHTTHVASVALRLAEAEQCDPLIPVIAALFHDAGKFSGGRYHEDGSTEEDESARIAESLLSESGMKPAEIKRVLAGLKALYKEDAGGNAVADLVHDADFLSKFGALGVAEFFVKSALRGRTLGSAVYQHLSKELTYAASLSLNMRTPAGRRLADKKAADSLKFFHALLRELRDFQIADLKICRVRFPHPQQTARLIEVLLVLPPACSSCGGPWHSTGVMEPGVKCKKLTVETSCSRCRFCLETSFCLPEIVTIGKVRSRWRRE